MVFLCGRPGCGRESTATLQIDAPSATVTLVDPRVSRDGVPLCPHHAEATTPPLGWTMNDLRSGDRSSAPSERSGPQTGEVVGRQAQPPAQSSRPQPRHPPQPEPPSRPRRRPTTGPDPGPDPGSAFNPSHDELWVDDGDDDNEESDGPLTFRVSRDLRSMTTSANGAHNAEATADNAADDRNGVSAGAARKPGARAGTPAAAKRARPVTSTPVSRPSKRRDESAIEDDEVDDDQFPWHYQFNNDEPQELQAKSRLLSRAFRSSVG